MHDRERVLARRASSGDSTAAEALYWRYVGRVWRYAWLRTRSRETAADIVQETFCRVFESGAQFEGRSSFSTWLFAVARSVAIKLARKERAEKRQDDPGILKLIPAPSDAEDEVERDEVKAAVRRAIGKLPGPQRDAVVLCDISGLKVGEAAEVLGWGESRVKVTLFRGRRRLRDLLREHVQRDVPGERGVGSEK